MPAEITPAEITEEHLMLAAKALDYCASLSKYEAVARAIAEAERRGAERERENARQKRKRALEIVEAVRGKRPLP